MEKKNFHQILKEAWGSVFSSRILWIFGFFVALSSLIQSTFLNRLFPSQDFEAVKTLFQNDPTQALGVTAGALILSSLIRLFGKANLISALSVLVSEKKNGPLTKAAFSGSKLVENFYRGFVIQFSIFCFLLILATVLALPPVFASWYKATAVDPLLIFTALAFFGITLLTLVLGELAFLYSILAKLSIRASFESAHLLFSRFFGRIIAFGFYSLALLFLFTFCLDLLILTIKIFWSSETGVMLLSLFFLSGFALLYQSLWFFFFRDLATPEVPPEEKESVLIGDKIPESPTV